MNHPAQPHAHLIGKAKRRIRTHRQHRRVRDRAPLFPTFVPLRHAFHEYHEAPSDCIPTSPAACTAARRVADCRTRTLPVPDLSRCTESSRGHLLGQFPLLLNTQIARLTSASHLVSEHLLHASLSVPAHPRLNRSLMHPHHSRRLTEPPTRPYSAIVHESRVRRMLSLCAR